MDEFILKEIKDTDIQSELEKIGFDSAYAHKAQDKFKYKNIKIYGLSLPQANILKQSAISVGADCAIHREVITAKVEKSDCILAGSYSQLKKIAQKLKQQPFRLNILGEQIENELNFELAPIKIKNTEFDFKKPYIVGVLNLTKDSFSDGGEFYDYDKSCSHLLEMVKDGADIIEIGAESTRPGASPISDDAQLEKLLPILEFVKEKDIKTPISVDTRSSKVAQKCTEKGANIINDVSGLDFDKNMAETIAKTNMSLIVQHSKGTPQTMQQNPHYDSLMDEVFLDLKSKIDLATAAGIKKENIIIDLGLGFGKTKKHNFEILKRFDELFSLKCPIMLGVSRKGLLEMKNKSNEEKDIYTLALNSLLIYKKVNFIRVHNVKFHKKLIELMQNF